MLRRLPRNVLFMAAIVAAALQSMGPAAAQELVPAQDAASLLGGERAQGAVIWSHGSLSCFYHRHPPKMASLADAGP